MKIYIVHPPREARPQLILHFGIGLIGSSIYESILYYFASQASFKAVDVPFVWKLESLQNNFTSIQKELQPSLLNHIEETSIIWSAGKAGFKAIEKEIDAEFELYKNALILLRNLRKTIGIKKASFYLFSSAGGLFEGQTDINSSSIPKPKRPYGVLKLKQEDYLRQHTNYSKKVIFRPSSVYSVKNIQARMGLIPTLVKNGIKNQISYIFGGEDTIRDYILDEEISDYVVRQIQADQEEEEHESITFLVSCKPSSIYQIKQIIENTLNFKLYIQYSLLQTNSKNMSFSSNLKPTSLKVTNLQTNIKKLYLNILNYKYESDLL